METIRLKAHIGSDGILKLETPTSLKDIDTEVVVVLQPARARDTDALGWPIAFFEAIDAIEADDLVERPDQGILEEREPSRTANTIVGAGICERFGYRVRFLPVGP